jgi:hypothetical protein
MPKAIMVVQTGPVSAEREEEYNDWYAGTHIPEVLAVPGFVGARRYKLAGGDGAPSYLAIYEIEADDIFAPVKELSARSAAGQHSKSDVLRTDPPPVVTIYQSVD